MLGADCVFLLIHYLDISLTLHLLFILLAWLVSDPSLFTWPVHFGKLTFIVLQRKAAAGRRKVFLFTVQIELVFEHSRTHCLREHIRVCSHLSMLCLAVQIFQRLHLSS